MAFVKFYKMFVFVNLVTFSTLVCFVATFPTGAPSYSCRNMIPGHNNGTQPGPPPYRVEVARTVLGAGERTKVSVSSTGDFPFLGFICAASDSDDMTNVTVGTMTHSAGFQETDLLKPITCLRSDPDSAMTHTSRREKYRVEFDWLSPANAVPGQGYKIRCTVVQSFFRCWTGIQVDLTIGQSITPSGSRAGNGVVNNDIPGNDAVSGISPNTAAFVPQETRNIPQQLPNLPPLNTAVNQFPSVSLPQSSIQSQDFGSTAVNRQNQRVVEPSVISRPTVSSSAGRQGDVFIRLPNQGNNMVFQGPGMNEILTPAETIELAFLVELISMGYNPFQDVVLNLDTNSNPSMSANTINQGRILNQITNPTEQLAFSRQSSVNFGDQPVADFNRHSRRSSRGPNSRGLFQSSNARPFNRGFNRIRRPRNLERSQISNRV